MDELVETMKSKLAGVEGFWSRLPVVRDYKEKELRREADKRVRQLLADSLSKIRNEISGLQVELLLSAQGLAQMDSFEQAVGKLQLLIDRVRTTTYGYAPLFDADKIREAELDKLIRFDRALAAEIPGLDEKVQALRQAVSEHGNVKSALKAVAGEISRLNELFSQRKQAIEGEDVPAPQMPEAPVPAEAPATESEAQPLLAAEGTSEDAMPANDAAVTSVAEPAPDPLADTTTANSPDATSTLSAGDLLSDLGNDPLGDDSKAD